MRKIALIGMMGSGKSTIAKYLSNELSLEYTSSDELIEKQENMSISDIFKKKGESYFRELEKKAVENLAKKDNTIIDTGGGIVLNEENIINLKKNGYLVLFIERKIDDIIESMSEESQNIRPLIKENIKKLYKINDERIVYYKRYCDLAFINDKKIESVVQKIKVTIESIKKIEYVDPINKQIVFF